MRQLDLLVRRKGVDPAAETCLHALQVLMQVAVERVERGTLWRFELESDAKPEVVRGLKHDLLRAACRAGRYLNPNRDAGVWLDEVSPPSSRSSVALLWILDGDGHDPAARAYFSQRSGARLRDLRRGTFYRLWIPGRDADAAARLAQEVAVSRTRKQGLLANPHSQTVELLELVPASDSDGV
jgi:phosphoribosylformylglycinamidine (FGAM) synthase PurS component